LRIKHELLRLLSSAAHELRGGRLATFWHHASVAKRYGS
jgi:hypothetical protein